MLSYHDDSKMLSLYNYLDSYTLSLCYQSQKPTNPISKVAAAARSFIGRRRWGLSSSGYCWRIRRHNSYTLMGCRDAKAERLVLAKGRSVSQASSQLPVRPDVVIDWRFAGTMWRRNSPAVSAATRTPNPQTPKPTQMRRGGTTEWGGKSSWAPPLCKPTFAEF
jgi:hypothetical protein